MKKLSNLIWSVCGAVLSILTFFSLSPRNIFRDTITSGGDTGAHVWWPKYFINELLPKLKLFGWSMDYFSGFPAGQFYFPVPVIMVSILDIIFPQNIAFKLVTISGAIILPISAIYLVNALTNTKLISTKVAALSGGLAIFVVQFFSGDSRVGTTVNSIGQVLSLDYQNAASNQRIMGGILPSTLAGEFSFTIAIAFLFFSIGALIKYFKGEKKLYLPVVFGALTIASHLVVGIVLVFISFTAFLVYFQSKKRDTGPLLLVLYSIFILMLANFFDLVLDGHVTILNLISLLPLVAILIILLFSYKDILVRKYFAFISLSFALVSWWLIPLLTHFQYTSSMRYEKIQDIATTPSNELYELYLFPRYAWWVGLGILLFSVFAIYYYFIRRKSMFHIFPQYKYLFSFSAVSMALFIFWPESHAWNIRFLPFYYFFVVMFAFVGYSFIIEFVFNNIFRFMPKIERRYFLNATISVLGTVVCILLIFGKTINADVQSSTSDNFLKDRRGVIPYWAQWNYEGYENKPNLKNNSSWLEFKNIMDTLDTLPKGRLLWERVNALDKYGTTVSLDLIPFFTNGKISSSEGLYFEASGTTAYHFLTAAYVSKEPSNPMRWPACGLDEIKEKITKCKQVAYGSTFDQATFELGVKKMQELGINYYMATSDVMNGYAKASKNLKLLKKIDDKDGTDPRGWSVYRVEKSNIIQSLEYNPLIVTNANTGKDWTQTGNSWLVNLFNQNILAISNTENIPKETSNSWNKITMKKARSINNNFQNKDKKLPKVKISYIKIENEKISFKVSKIGVPILIKVSYYPDWISLGATQPTRISPNHMLVIPTSKTVILEFKRSSAEKIGMLISFTTFMFLLYLIMKSLYPWIRTNTKKLNYGLQKNI